MGQAVKTVPSSVGELGMEVVTRMRAPMTPLNAFSNDTMPVAPMFGVATGTFPPAFGRFVSAILALLCP